MGFPCVMKMTNYTSIRNLLNHFKFLLMMALSHLGLPKPQEAGDSAEESYPTTHVLILETPAPTIVTIQVQELASLIKKKLPVVEYIDFLKRFGQHHEGMSDFSYSKCNVCLDMIEERQEIRELSNCCHVFHKHCLDCWIDVGQFTCPLCRSMLLPCKGSVLSRPSTGRYHSS